MNKWADVWLERMMILAKWYSCTLKLFFVTATYRCVRFVFGAQNRNDGFFEFKKENSWIRIHMNVNELHFGGHWSKVCESMHCVIFFLLLTRIEGEPVVNDWRVEIKKSYVEMFYFHTTSRPSKSESVSLALFLSLSQSVSCYFVCLIN